MHTQKRALSIEQVLAGVSDDSSVKRRCTRLDVMLKCSVAR